MSAPRPLRLFIALWPPAHVRDAIAQWQSAWQWPQKASVVKPERLHVTLHFLGDVAPDRLDGLVRALGRVPVQAFELHFGQAQSWQQGVAVLRPATSPTPLRALQARIGLAIAQAGFPLDDRAYRPHVTLARRAYGATPPPQDADVRWECRDGFVLVQTLPGGRGYEVVQAFEA
jgi:2'-5' RNA ligase